MGVCVCAPRRPRRSGARVGLAGPKHDRYAASKPSVIRMSPWEELQSDLRRYYDARGIGAVDFDCTHSPVCRAAAEHVGGRFVTAREPTVGVRYLAGWPRILVVSLDPGSLDEPTPIQLRSEEPLGPPNCHWHRTHEGVAEIIYAGTGERLTPAEAGTWFAHLNVVRCCANRVGRREAPNAMFMRCHEYLEGEVRIFRPDLIWSQGDKAWDAMAWALPHLMRKDVVDLDGRPSVWLHSTHPAAHSLRAADKWQEQLADLRARTKAELRVPSEE